jgi:hypothetical protein
MSKMIREMRIRPGKNGGHEVVHEYQSSPTHSKGMGMMMEHTPSESHIFGSGEGHKMLAHVANTLAIPATEEDAESGPGQEKD